MQWRQRFLAMVRVLVEREVLGEKTGGTVRLSAFPLDVLRTPPTLSLPSGRYSGGKPRRRPQLNSLPASHLF